MIKRKLKIVHIEDYFDPNAGYQINELIKYNENFQHIIICSYDLSPFHKEYSKVEDNKCEETFNVKIIRLESVLKYSRRILLKGWLKKVESLNPDILFMHGIGDFKDTLLWRFQKKFIVIRDCHMSWVASHNKLAPLYFLFFKMFFAGFINRTNKYQKVLALGIEEKAYLKKLGLNDKKIDIMHHGYDSNQFFYDAEAGKKFRTDNNIPQTSKVICYTGKMDSYKKPHLILECLNYIDLEIIKKHDITLLFVGNQESNYFESVLLPKIKEFQPKMRIIIKHAVPVKDLRSIYNASDICFWPKETTLSSIHAQACGTNVIMEKQVFRVDFKFVDL